MRFFQNISQPKCKNTSIPKRAAGNVSLCGLFIRFFPKSCYSADLFAALWQDITIFSLGYTGSIPSSIKRHAPALIQFESASKARKYDESTKGSTGHTTIGSSRLSPFLSRRYEAARTMAGNVSLRQGSTQIPTSVPS